MAESAMSIWPFSSAGTTSPVPLYGTWMRFTPAARAKASASRCVTLPGQEVNQTTDRVKEMSKHFNKQ